jgi:hypothetical protein
MKSFVVRWLPTVLLVFALALIGGARLAFGQAGARILSNVMFGCAMIYLVVLLTRMWHAYLRDYSHRG